MTMQLVIMCKLQIKWKDPEHHPVTPQHLGIKAFLDFPIEDVIDYIDWNPFFQVTSC